MKLLKNHDFFSLALVFFTVCGNVVYKLKLYRLFFSFFFDWSVVTSFKIIDLCGKIFIYITASCKQKEAVAHVSFRTRLNVWIFNMFYLYK